MPARGAAGAKAEPGRRVISVPSGVSRMVTGAAPSMAPGVSGANQPALVGVCQPGMRRVASGEMMAAGAAFGVAASAAAKRDASGAGGPVAGRSRRKSPDSGTQISSQTSHVACRLTGRGPVAPLRVTDSSSSPVWPQVTSWSWMIRWGAGKRGALAVTPSGRAQVSSGAAPASPGLSQ